MENRKCKDCIWWSPSILACFYDANEGMRVFVGNQKACQWWNKPQNYDNLNEKD